MRSEIILYLVAVFAVPASAHVALSPRTALENVLHKNLLGKNRVTSFAAVSAERSWLFGRPHVRALPLKTNL